VWREWELGVIVIVMEVRLLLMLLVMLLSRLVVSGHVL
jgi:hypothetical protein